MARCWMYQHTPRAQWSPHVHEPPSVLQRSIWRSSKSVPSSIASNIESSSTDYTDSLLSPFVCQSSDLCDPDSVVLKVSGVCLSQLESPPTMSPTSSAGGLDVYYPNYDTVWDKAACVNTRPMPSGRPFYPTMLDCCKGSYSGQMSGFCLSQLDAPPTTSPTSSDVTADFWYPGEQVENK